MNTSSVYNEKIEDSKAQYSESEKKVEWFLPVVKGGSRLELVSKIILGEEISMYQIKKELGPVKMSFEVNQK